MLGGHYLEKGRFFFRGFYNLPSSFANSSGVSMNGSSGGEYSAMTVTLHTSAYYVHVRAC